MYNSNLNYSSFWLDRSIWDDDDQEVTKVEKKSNDLMKLMSYKRSSVTSSISLQDNLSLLLSMVEVRIATPMVNKLLYQLK